jgi:putative tryptophan/tyrosine transport system substrate-binding protein
MHFHQWNRRETITFLGGAAVAWSLRARAQQTGKVPRIGLLWPGSSGPDPVLDAFYRGLREYGYTEGRDAVFERVDADFKLERFSQLAAELVRRKVDVIFVFSTSPARAVKEATGTIPIVVTAMADPVGDELIDSLARPGGNLTGNTFIGPELIAKRLGLLKQAITSRRSGIPPPTANARWHTW